MKGNISSIVNRPTRVKPRDRCVAASRHGNMTWVYRAIDEECIVLRVPTLYYELCVMHFAKGVPENEYLNRIGMHANPAFVIRIADYAKFLDKLTSECFDMTMDDWRATMENDAKSAEKIAMGRERYHRSLGTKKRYAYLYKGWNVIFPARASEDEMLWYIAYHRLTPVRIVNRLMCPMWMQAEFYIGRL